MKKIIILLAIMFAFGVNTQAKKWTVSNNPNIPAMFTNAQIACDSATIGDTIYIAASIGSYGDITVKKRLTIIGAGTTKLNTASQFGTISLDTLETISGASNSVFMGLSFAMVITYNNCKSVVCLNNRIQSLGLGGNNNAYYFTLANNYITGGIAGRGMYSSFEYLLRSFIISNNNFTNYGYINNVSNCVISNNLFFHGGTPITGCNYNLILNNIFIGNPYYGFIDKNSCSNNNIRNNLSYPGLTLCNSVTNTDSFNIVANPLFVLNATSETYSITDDYHLQASSPGKTASANGTEIGIYGGSLPYQNSFPDIYNYPKAPFPVVTDLIVNTPLVPKNGNLNVSIKAIKGN